MQCAFEDSKYTGRNLLICKGGKELRTHRKSSNSALSSDGYERLQNGNYYFCGDSLWRRRRKIMFISPLSKPPAQGSSRRIIATIFR